MKSPRALYVQRWIARTVRADTLVLASSDSSVNRRQPACDKRRQAILSLLVSRISLQAWTPRSSCQQTGPTPDLVRVLDVPLDGSIPGSGADGAFVRGDVRRVLRCLLYRHVVCIRQYGSASASSIASTSSSVSVVATSVVSCGTLATGASVCAFLRIAHRHIRHCLKAIQRLVRLTVCALSGATSGSGAGVDVDGSGSGVLWQSNTHR